MNFSLGKFVYALRHKRCGMRKKRRRNEENYAALSV